ncbi:hypothetical protein [Pseudoalteromonas piscicida]|uniref:hypothetical protein n=1 Tax=Pseudoalteromonas piscicida TaxID=43662 RepID=UPI0005FA7AF3|nr:hypothetical protein [Pseudoalteromonas piscicida]KJY94925.1 hypothetical protein TW73_17435 [Pseudoalteromonas piscicida]
MLSDKTRRYLKKNRALLIVTVTIVFLFFLNWFWVEEQTFETVMQSIVVTGLPSLLALALVTLLVEYSIRRDERKELKRFIREQSGFVKYVAQYPNIPSVINNLLSMDDDDGVEEVKILMVGSDTGMIKSILDSINQIYRSKCSLEILLLDPESDHSMKRGESLNKDYYQQHIRSNLSSLKSWLAQEIKKPHPLISDAKIKLYGCQIPSALTIQIGNEFIIFSPVWATESVKDGPFCFVPKDNGMFDMLAKAYNEVEAKDYYEVNVS